MNYETRQMKKYIRFIPVLLVVIAILALTVQNKAGTTALSDTTRVYFEELCTRLGIDSDSEWWNTKTSIRWFGHALEYFALGLVSGFAFVKKRYALILCVFISIIDQITKIYVPVRHFDPEDIPFDIIGFCSGIAITWVVGIAAKWLREDEGNN